MALDGHRSGSLKQQNKVHKHGKHRSKGTCDREAGGKTNVKSFTKEAKKSIKKKERRKQAFMNRKQKREELLEQRRGRGGAAVPPLFVVVFALHSDVDPEAAVNTMQRCDESNTVRQNEQGITHLSVQRFKQRLAFYIPPRGNLHALLDAAKTADVVLGLLSPAGGVDSLGDSLLSCLCGHGLPAIMFACPGIKSIPLKQQTACRQDINRKLQKRFPGEKFHSLDSDQDAVLLLRQLANQKLKPVHFRKNRPHLVAEFISFEMENEECQCGTLKVSGYLRGTTLSVNRLVHLPGWGDFQMDQIDVSPDPYPLSVNRRQGKDVEMEDSAETNVLERADPAKQQKLTMVGNTDVEMEEEDEAEGSEKMASRKRVVKTVVAGASEYQSAWILDSDDDEEDEEDIDSDEDMAPEEEEGSDEEDEDVENASTVDDNATTGPDDTEKYDAQMDLEEERKLLEKKKAEKEDSMFPDEIDTPFNTPARIRFAKYCGLESFRTSPWEHREDIPDFYQSVAVGDLKRMKKGVLKMPVEGGAMPGSYVTVHLAQVPRTFMTQYEPRTPIVLFGLLPGEQYTSVLNMGLRREHGSHLTIRSGDRLVFHVGFRRFSACPLYSQHTAGNKHKFERFFGQERVVVASVLAPLIFPPAPVLALWEHPDGRQEVVARGSLLDLKPDRLIIKRVVLSGVPLKIHKQTAVIRLMFFNREDILYFKKVELRTKWGRRGHILEPLGTHGHMKCHFSGGLKSHQDTVLMSLYKRVFPKPSYDVAVNNPKALILPSAAEAEESDEDEVSDSDSKAAYAMFD